MEETAKVEQEGTTEQKEMKLEDAKNVVTLKRPLVLDGEEIEKLTLNFDKMTGADILQIDKELRMEGLYFDNLWNQQVILKLASRGTGIIADDLLSLHPGDYLELAMRTRNFFLQW